jgi:hypothetical protein
MLQAMWVQFGVFIVYVVPMNVLVQQIILQLEPWIAQLWTDWSRIRILAKVRHFLFSKMSGMALGPTKPPTQWVLEVLSPCGQGVRLTTHPLHAFMACAGTTSHLPFCWHSTIFRVLIQYSTNLTGMVRCADIWFQGQFMRFWTFKIELDT